MESNLKHEDLLIKLRGKLNDEKIKLWEPPFYSSDDVLSESLKELANKYAANLSLESEMVLKALRELQLHSMERVKANDEFKETGLATFRVKVTVQKEKPTMLKIQKMLDVSGSDLISAVASEMGIDQSRVKLISNGKIIKPDATLKEQNLKNGTLLMALVLDATPEEVKKEDEMYNQMKSTRDDAILLSDYVNEVADTDDYIKLEDQSGKTVELPKAERKSLLVGLALHERGRTAIKQKDYSLALILLLEADRQFSECRSSLLQSVDNWGILQLDIAWCYAGLRSVGGAADAATRLAAAEKALSESYGRDQRRLMEVKGSAANERVLLMRLYLLQGIVAFHQNKRAEAKTLLEKAEAELNNLRVDEDAVSRLMELGWSRTQARVGLRGAAGDPDRAHLQLAALAETRAAARERHRRERQHKLLGECIDGTAVDAVGVRSLVEMGFPRTRAVSALRQSNNNVSDAVTLLQQEPSLLDDATISESSSASSEELPTGRIDDKLVAELESMGYNIDEVKAVLRMCNYHVETAVELLMAREDPFSDDDATKPSTSAGEEARLKLKQEREKKRLERDLALQRLSSAIRSDEDDYLDTSLLEEEQYLDEYKSLL